MPEVNGGTAGCLRTVAIYLLLMAPLYALLRFFVRLIRQSYGFAPEEADDGPPLRVCGACHNTVLEPEFAHCPYCGAPLAEPDRAPQPQPRQGEGQAPAARSGQEPKPGMGKQS